MCPPQVQYTYPAPCYNSTNMRVDLEVLIVMWSARALESLCQFCGDFNYHPKLAILQQRAQCQNISKMYFCFESHERRIHPQNPSEISAMEMIV